MRWKGRRRSDYVQDRRSQQPAMGSVGGSSGLLRLIPALLGTKSGRTILIVGVLVIVGSRMMGIDLLPLLLGSGGTSVVQSSGAGSSATTTEAEDELAEFAAVILADTEDTWGQIFAAEGRQYPPPTLVLFRGQVHSACGTASSAVGPFYCPADQQLYLDLDFFDELSRRFGAPGDFAQAYVIAHEVGHHIQTVLGISQRVRDQGRGLAQAQVNALSVRQELQADCFAGIWGHYASAQGDFLESGDFEEAITAASAIGDDTLQRNAGGRVVPDSFTHGTSEQRMRWFRTGFEQGSLNACDTFEGRR